MHFVWWTLAIYGAAQLWKIIFRQVFTNVVPNAAAATVLGS